ncbi:MAG: hypothetical protein QM479_06790 [Pseudomonadota bacterium]
MSKFITGKFMQKLKLMVRKLLASRYYLNNIFSKEAITDSSSNLLISLTSHDIRIKSVFYAIESMGLGLSKPNRIILWLSHNDLKKIPSSLQRLQKRGLEIKSCEDIKSYKKLIPLTTIQNELSGIDYIVTADDDIIFPKNWLNLFLANLNLNKKLILSQRARIIRFKNNQLDRYNNWPPISSQNNIANCLIFPTGVAGVCYPVSFLSVLKKEGEIYKEIAPKQDDVWFWAVALYSNYMPKFIHNKNLDILKLVPGSQSISLWSQNQLIDNISELTANDLAIEKVINKFSIKLLE